MCCVYIILYIKQVPYSNSTYCKIFYYGVQLYYNCYNYAMQTYVPLLHIIRNAEVHCASFSMLLSPPP